MPEEIDRVLTDVRADYHFITEEDAIKNSPETLEKLAHAGGIREETTACPASPSGKTRSAPFPFPTARTRARS
jgi:hypothetical protein